MSREETARRIRIGHYELVLAPVLPGEIFPGLPASFATVRGTLLHLRDEVHVVARLRHAVLEIDSGADRLDELGIVERVARQVELGRWHLEPWIDERPALDPIDVTDLSDLRRPEVEEPEIERKHFIEIALIDEDDQPVAGERYRIELPNGRVVQGRTTADGLARVDDIADPGACKISFPDRDVETWEPV